MQCELVADITQKVLKETFTHVTNNCTVRHVQKYSTACSQILIKIVTSSLNLGRDGALVESITFNRRVVGSTPALAAT